MEDSSPGVRQRVFQVCACVLIRETTRGLDRGARKRSGALPLACCCWMRWLISFVLSFFLPVFSPSPHLRSTPSQSLQDAVLEVIRQAGSIDKPLVLRKAKEVRSRHRSPEYCDRIAEMFS